MGCPFFLPTETFDNKAWHHRPQLPLGDGYLGRCEAKAAEEFVPDTGALQNFCNFGCAFECPRFPKTTATDAVRFAVIGDRDNVLTIYYVLEKDHQSAEYGQLEYNVAEHRFLSSFRNPVLRRQAEVYFQSYLRRKGSSVRRVWH